MQGPAGHTPTLAEIGAAPASHGHIKANISDFAHTHTPAEAGEAASSHSHNYAASPSPGGPANTMLGSYTGNGGQQGPNYFGRNKAGCLMMNTPVNGDYNYKDWLLMDGYSGDDVGGGTAIGVDRQSMRAFVMGSNADRSAWARSAELVTTANILNMVYPVGSIYMSISATNPGSLFGGSWERYAVGRVIVGVSEGEGEFAGPGYAGGEKYHTLTVNEMPSHSHGGGTGWQSADHAHSIGYRVMTDGDRYVVDRQVTSAGFFATTTGVFTGGVTANHYHGIPADGVSWGHNNMQPYIAVYIWRRIG
jgi:microcystin-dependent protein